VSYDINGRSPVFLAVVTSGPDAGEHEILDVAVVGTDGSTLLHTALLPSRPDKGVAEFLVRAGYSDGEWAPSPSENDVGQALLKFLENRLVVGHDVQRAMRFVRPVVRQILESKNVPPDAVLARMLSIDSPWIDTVTLAWEQIEPCGLENLSLASVAEFLGIELNTPTSALQEARAVREVYRTLLRLSWWRRFICRLRARRVFS